MTVRREARETDHPTFFFATHTGQLFCVERPTFFSATHWPPFLCGYTDQISFLQHTAQLFCVDTLTNFFCVERLTLFSTAHASTFVCGSTLFFSVIHTDQYILYKNTYGCAVGSARNRTSYFFFFCNTHRPTFLCEEMYFLFFNIPVNFSVLTFFSFSGNQSVALAP